ncbi:MAG TPA: sugar phosphate isomerase/epimerase [Bryobacteraceae bacterium]|nr:sugar phosphate isomerase/epimerase [Bryobacteraceae bacterium]
MITAFNRRTFLKTAALGLGAASAASALTGKHRAIQIGQTILTWAMPLAEPDQIEQGIRDIASLGYYGIELFGTNLQALQENGETLIPLLQKYNVPLVSCYCNVHLTDPVLFKTSLERLVEAGNIIKKAGGRVAVLGPNAVPRETYDFKAYKSQMVSRLNECGKAVTDLGLTAVFHQHTSTCIETREETVAVMEAVDTRYVKFGPDIGQLQKGGADPLEILKHFLPIVQHCHLKDYLGGPNWAGYCPLGQGKLDIPAILDLFEGKQLAGMVMVELDQSEKMPLTAIECSKASKAYLEKLGCGFRS